MSGEFRTPIATAPRSHIPTPATPNVPEFPPYQARPTPIPGRFRNWLRQHIPYHPGPPIPFHYMSDLRLWETDYAFPLCPRDEFKKRILKWRREKEKKQAEYLILAGNCFRLKDKDKVVAWLTETAEHYDHVLVVPGPGEFYGDTIANGVRAIEKMMGRQGEWRASEVTGMDGLRNVRILNRRRFDVPGSDVSILGCTLFSKISADQAEAARNGCEAFRMIDEWDVGHHNLMHRVDVSWLQDEVRKVGEIRRRPVVVTHHAPTLVGTVREEDAEYCEALASNCLAHGKWKGVEVWIHGGTRMSSTFFTVDDIKVISNQPRQGVKGQNAKHCGGKGDTEWNRKRGFGIPRMSEWKVRAIDAAGRKRVRRTTNPTRAQAVAEATAGNQPGGSVGSSGRNTEIQEATDERVRYESQDEQDERELETWRSTDRMVLPLPMTEEQAGPYLADLERWYYDRRPGEE